MTAPTNMTTDTESRIRESLQLWDTDMLLDAIACTRREIWLGRVMRYELVNRGLGRKGEWVGFKRAAIIWCDQEGA